MSNHAYPASLVSTQWVADHLADPTVRLVEASWDDDDYRAGHIPGAVYWSFVEELKTPAFHDAPDLAATAALLSRSGIDAATTVVLYGNISNLVAAYAFWLLKYYGHADVRLVDGGRQCWLDEGRPVSTSIPVYTPTAYHIEQAVQAVRARRDDLLHAIDDPGTVIVDLRALEMYLGAHNASAARGGHIPSAINVPATRETDSDGAFLRWRMPTVKGDWTFRPVEELRALFTQAGITPDKQIITYCVLGGLSSHAWFVLTQLLGYPDVREYDRSWVEWGNSAELPIATHVSGQAPRKHNEP